MRVGDKAPAFTAIDTNGKRVRLSDYKGKKVVLYFYPKDNTPGCINQACNLRDHYKELQKEGLIILGVSADTEIMHKKFTDKFDLPFDLIADTDKKVIEKYGVWGPKKFMGREYDGIHRTTFIIDEKQQIIGIIERPKTKYHAEEILQLLTENSTT